MENTIEQRDVQAREVFGGGYVLAGNRRYNSVTDGTNVASQTIEFVAADRTAALAAITSFLNTGAFV